MIQGQYWQKKKKKAISTNGLDMVHPSYAAKHKQETRTPDIKPGHKARPYLKNNLHKRAESVTQVIKLLPSKHETLSLWGGKYPQILIKKFST
jgi:hypothetical protein